MASPAPNALLDTIDLANLGIHSGVDAELLQDNQSWFAVNATARGGKWSSRPPIQKITLEFESETTQTNFTQARFQGAEIYEAIDAPNFILAMVGGRLFKIDIANDIGVVSDISTSLDKLNNPNGEQAWFFQGEQFMVINDGQDYPLFFDGAKLWRSQGQKAQELPVGAMGHYVNGRIVMALPDRRSFIAGDIVGSTASGTAAYGYRDSILKTTENLTILGGVAFAIPLNAGKITAMFSVAIPDTSLGQGPLQIGTRKGIFSVNLPLDSNLWTTLQQPSSVVSLPSFGPLSQDSVVIVNGDGWYRGVDGIRSFAVARKDFNTWVQTALSSEMDAILPLDTQRHLWACSATLFDNRLLTTCSPYTVDGRGVANRGLVALDFNNISSITFRSSPIYDGLWTGLNILKILSGEIDSVERCFQFALDEDNNICLYELLPTDTSENFDHNGEADVPIESWLISNSLFGRISQGQRSLPMKKLIVGDMFWEELAGNVQFDVKYRSDQYPFWVDWKTYSVCAPATNCPENCDPFLEVQRQYATFIRLPEPQDTCHPITKRMLRTGYEFQVKAQWTGRARLDKMLLWAVPIPETIPHCPSEGVCQILEGCTDDFFTHSIE